MFHTAQEGQLTRFVGSVDELCALTPTIVKDIKDIRVRNSMIKIDA